MFTNQSHEAEGAYQPDISLYTLFDDARVNFRISHNRHATLDRVDGLIGAHPGNKHLKTFKTHLETFYNAITNCDFDTFAALFPAFSAYIKSPKEPQAQYWVNFLLIVLNPRRTLDEMTLSQHLFWERLLGAQGSLFTIRENYQKRTEHLLWIELLSEGYHIPGSGSKMINTRYFQLKNYFQSELTIADDLKQFIAETEMTATALWNLMPRQNLPLEQFRKLLDQLPHLLLELTPYQKRTLCPPDSDISVVLFYCSRVEKEHLNDFLMVAKETKFASIQEALTAFNSILQYPNRPWAIQRVAEKIHHQLLALNTHIQSGQVFNCDESITLILQGIFSILSIDSMRLFDNYPKATITERLYSEDFFNNLQTKLDPNGQYIEELRLMNQEWIDFLAGKSMPAQPKDPALSLEIQRLKEFFDDVTYPINYAGQFENLLSQGMTLNHIWKFMHSLANNQTHAVHKMHTLFVRHQNYGLTEEDKQCFRKIEWDRGVIEVDTTLALINLVQMAQKNISNLTTRSSEREIRDARRVLGELDLTRKVLLTQFNKGNDAVVSGTSLVVYKNLESKLTAIEHQKEAGVIGSRIKNTTFHGSHLAPLFFSSRYDILQPLFSDQDQRINGVRLD